MLSKCKNFNDLYRKKEQKPEHNLQNSKVDSEWPGAIYAPTHCFATNFSQKICFEDHFELNMMNPL